MLEIGVCASWSTASLANTERVRHVEGMNKKTSLFLNHVDAYVEAAQRELAKARFDTLLSQLRLKASVGALGEADLEQINPLFEAP